MYSETTNYTLGLPEIFLITLMEKEKVRDLQLSKVNDFQTVHYTIFSPLSLYNFLPMCKINIGAERNRFYIV